MHRHHATARRGSLDASIMLLALILACSDAPLTPLPPGPEVPRGVPLTITHAGDGQQALRGSQLPTALQVRILTNGTPLPGIAISWTTTSGTVAPTTSTTDAEGVATAVWRLGLLAGPVTAAATIAGQPEQSVTFSATALPLLSVRIDSTTDHQSAQVGTALPKRLRVTVLADGAPASNWPVGWQVSSGRIIPIIPRSQGDGTVEALWVLGTTAGEATAIATVDGLGEPHASFTATGSAGPAAQITVVSGDNQSRLLGYHFETLVVAVADEFANPADATAVGWEVVSGPIRIGYAFHPTRDQSAAFLVTPDTLGPGVIRASLPTGGLHADFNLAVEPRPWDVTLNTLGGLNFVSDRNGSSPAVDTVKVGQTLTWGVLPFDYDQHAVASIGTPGFPGGGPIPYGSRATVSATFTSPGTYAYWDPFSGATGTVVVE